MLMLNRSARRAKRMTSRTIKVDYLARVEGEGALYVKIKDERVTDVKLKIEPPRFFTSGRSCESTLCRHLRHLPHRYQMAVHWKTLSA
jgi:hypothetical protein